MSSGPVNMETLLKALKANGNVGDVNKPAKAAASGCSTQSLGSKFGIAKTILNSKLGEADKEGALKLVLFGNEEEEEEDDGVNSAEKPDDDDDVNDLADAVKNMRTEPTKEEKEADAIQGVVKCLNDMFRGRIDSVARTLEVIATGGDQFLYLVNNKTNTRHVKATDKVGIVQNLFDHLMVLFPNKLQGELRKAKVNNRTAPATKALEAVEPYLKTMLQTHRARLSEDNVYKIMEAIADKSE